MHGIETVTTLYQVALRLSSPWKKKVEVEPPSLSMTGIPIQEPLLNVPKASYNFEVCKVQDCWYGPPCGPSEI